MECLNAPEVVKGVEHISTGVEHISTIVLVDI